MKIQRETIDEFEVEENQSSEENHAQVEALQVSDLNRDCVHGGPKEVVGRVG